MTLRNYPDTFRKASVRTSAQWRAVGVTAAQLRALVRSGDLVPVRHGVYATRRAAAAAENNPRYAHAVQVAAVRASVGRDVIGSHQSAALVHGFELLKQPPAQVVTVTCAPSRRTRNRTSADVLIYRAALPGQHVTTAYGTKITTPSRTVVDLARALPFIDAVVVADAALRAGQTTKAELAGVCDACERWPGVAEARQVVAFSSAFAESALESCARVMFDAFGVEEPQIQVTIRGPGFVYRVDFCWEKRKTIAEADGLAKYASREDMLAQFRRDRLLRDAGYKVVHFTWRELFETAEMVIARITKAMADPTPY